MTMVSLPSRSSHGSKPKSVTERPILSHPICALDFETTGLNKTTRRAVEIALVRREPNETYKHGRVCSKVKKYPVSQKIHNISNAMIRHAPLFRHLSSHQTFYKTVFWLLITVLSIWNFSKRVIFETGPSTVAVLDTLTMARSFLISSKQPFLFPCVLESIWHNAHPLYDRNALFLFWNSWPSIQNRTWAFET